jgi:hypothetical protein
VTRLRWDAPRWFDDAAAWIDVHVERTGDLELLRTRPWSALIRVPSDGGDLWFKEAAQRRRLARDLRGRIQPSR